MKLFSKAKDGGPDSPVIGYFLVEIKSLFSVVLLHFTGTREAYHSHAFNALTLWLRGTVQENVMSERGEESRIWQAGELKYTPRKLMHKILPFSQAWALSIRGPWVSTWREFLPGVRRFVTLTHGRKVVN